MSFIDTTAYGPENTLLVYNTITNTLKF